MWNRYFLLSGYRFVFSHRHAGGFLPDILQISLLMQLNECFSLTLLGQVEFTCREFILMPVGLAENLILFKYTGRDREVHRHEFHSGTFQGRILGDENFSKKVLALAEEKWKNRSTLNQIIDAVCLSYGIEQDICIEPGKKQPGAEARAMAAYLVQEEEHLSLTDLGGGRS